MALKLNSPLVGTGIGGAASLATQGILRAALKEDPAKPSEGVKAALINYPGVAGAVVSLATAGGLYLAKQRQAALGAAVGALIASAPGVILDVKAAKERADAAKALPPADTKKKPADGTDAGLGALRVRSAFGAVRALGISPSKFGTPVAAL